MSVEELEAARAVMPIATVQNLYHLARRDSEDVLQRCETHGIGFIPWFPLAAGRLARPGGLLDRVAARLAASQAQVALAWLLRKSPVMLPIPGTGRVAHLEENVAATALRLSDEDVAALDAAGATAWEGEASRR